jgi:hydrogenase-4 component B
MTANIITYAIFVSLVGMLFSAVISLLKNSFKTSSRILFFSTLAGFLAGLGYLVNFSGQNLIVADFSSLFGATLELNYLSGLFFTLVAGVASLVVAYGSEYLKRYQKVYDIQKVQFLTSLFILGMLGVLLSGNAILFLVFWEMMSVASFFLVMSDKTEESLRAAFIYFVMTHLGAAAILGGFLILGQGSLSFEFGRLAEAQASLSSGMALLAFLLFLFGFGSKAGLIPFHIWLPAAHPQAPTNISALMSGLMLKIAIFGFLKIAFSFSNLPLWTAGLVIELGITSAIFGALYSAIARDIKRALAYSSIENMGIIFTMLGVALFVIAKDGNGSASPLAVSLIAFAIFHSLNHAIFKTGLFLASGVIIGKFHSKSLEAMGGLAKIMPWFSFIFLILALSGSALPPFGAFYGEWGFIRALIELLHSQYFSASSLVAILFVLSLFAMTSGLAIFAMVKIFGISMLGLSRTKIHETSADPKDKLMIYPIAILSLMMVLAGIFAKNILDFISGSIIIIFSQEAGVPSSIVIAPQNIFGIFVVLFGLSFAAYKLFSKNDCRIREYHTWDCGQPIDASMEYTATAFSAPIRFFFLAFVQRSKSIVSIPVLATNPWIAKKSFEMTLTSAWKERFYKPGFKMVFWLADKIRLIHAGRIQYYLLMLLATVVLALIIAL